MNDVEPISVGIVGLGRSGWDIHAGLLESVSENYKVAAVVDKIPERRAEAVHRFGCAEYSDFESLIQDSSVDLVVVASPSNFHTSQTIQALMAGKSVVCEKPMATSLEDADKMIECSKSTGKLLTVFQNRRYAPDFLTVKRIVDSGVLGRIILIRIAYHGFGRRWDWQTLKKLGGGTLNNTCPHPVDQALVLLDAADLEVFCVRDKTLTLGDADDHVKIILKGPDTPSVEVEATSACAYAQPTWLVMGTRGGLTGSGGSIKWKYFEPKDLPRKSVAVSPTPDRSYNRESLPLREESWTADKDKTSAYQAKFYLELYETIKKDRPLSITPESVRKQIWVLDECRRLAPV